MSDWLELELSDGMAPVRAPEELWDRVCAARANAPNRAPMSLSRRLYLLPVAAILICGAAVGWSLSEWHPAIDLERAAADELKSSPTYYSANATEINGWLARNAGVDAAIKPAASVELSGARIVERNGVRFGEVLYRAAGRDAALLVARNNSGAALKAFSKHGQRTWQSRGQIYAVACTAPSQQHLECLLCHS